MQLKERLILEQFQSRDYSRKNPRLINIISLAVITLIRTLQNRGECFNSN